LNFSFSDEQQMLADTIGRFVEKDYPFETRRRIIETGLGYSPEHWKMFAEMGLLGLTVPSEHGGSAASSVEVMIVMEALGRGLVVEPYASTAVGAVALLTRFGSSNQKKSMLPALNEGQLRLAVAALEPGARFDLWSVSTQAKGNREAGYTLSGKKAVVIDGDSADRLIVSARTAEGRDSESGISLFFVDAAAPGVFVRSFPSLDGHRIAEITLDNVVVGPGDLICSEGEGYEPLVWMVDHLIAALCAEAVGAMDMLTQMTIEHLRTRQQFGQPLGKFQALQHRAADMVSAVEQARSITLRATAYLDHDNAIERRKAVSAAKAIVGRSARLIGEESVQMHGGMGMTDELPVGHYFKRLTCIDMSWGNVDHHVELYSPYL
jgi:alkylation response protein AidB-like acyl-CoA dehydrogenase